MNIKKRIIIIVSIIFIFLLNRNIYAKYKYTFELDGFELTRDNSEIEYQLEISESDKEYTNRDVVLKIITNKEIERVDNFELSKDRKTLSRLVTENESNIIVLEDLFGNNIMVEYNISNIDKIPPEIIGIEDGKEYKEVKNIVYRDNIGIRSIIINKYDDFEEKNKLDNYNTKEVYNNDINNIIDEGSYKLIVTDLAGNKTECKIKIKK